MVEDVAVALGGGTGIDAADGLRDGRDDEKPPLGKRLAEERGNVPFVPHPPRQDENKGRSSLQEDVEGFLLQRTLKPAHHAHPFVAHPRRPVERKNQNTFTRAGTYYSVIQHALTQTSATLRSRDCDPILADQPLSYERCLYQIRDTEYNQMLHQDNHQTLGG